MENSTTPTSNTNPKNQSDTDGFNIPVSSSNPTTPAPTVTDFTTPSSSSSSSLFNPPTSSSTFDSSPMPTSSSPLPSMDSSKDSLKNSTPTNPKLSAPIHGQNYKGNGSKTMSLIIGLVILILIVGCVYGVYSWQHSKVTKAESTNSALSTEVTNLQTQLNSAQKNLAAAQASLDNSTVDVSQLGFSITVPNALKDLTFASVANPTKLTVNGASVTPTEVDVSSTSLAALDPACSTANGALGVLSKTTGQYPTTPTTTNASGTTLIEQFTTYYLAYNTPTTTCSKTASVNATQTTLVDDLKTALGNKSNIIVSQ